MAVPAGVIIQGILGAAQLGMGASAETKGRKALESLILRSPQYKPDEGIMGLYRQYLERAGVSPTQSALYKRQMQNIGRTGATGMLNLQRSGDVLGGTSSLTRQLSDAALNAEVAAEQQRNQLAGQALGSAQLASGEKQREFDINVVRPWQLRAQMAGQKGAAAAQTFNIGAGNIFGAASSLDQMRMYKDLYGNKSGGLNLAGIGNFLGKMLGSQIKK